MQFSISGADRNTGTPVTIIINAISEHDAYERALGMDVLVSTVDRIADAPAPHPEQLAPPTDPTDPTLLRLRRIAQRSRTRAPNYFWIKVLGYFFFGLGVLELTICVVSMIIALAGGVAVANKSKAPEAVAVFTGVASIAGFLVGLAISGVFMAMGQLLLALRDIAQNSWCWPRMEQTIAN